MKHHRKWFVILVMSLVWMCGPARSQQGPVSQAQPATATSNEPEINAEYGVVPGRLDFKPDNPAQFIRDAGYPPGVFAVSIPDRTQLLAFDPHSNFSAVCNRVDPSPVAIPDQGGTYFRFRCPGTWDKNEVVFLDTTAFVPTSGELLEWSPLAGPSPLSLSRTSTPGDLHDYAASARPGLLHGQYLISAAWFAGQYLPLKEHDELRGDTIAFGHYTLLDRTLFIGESQTKRSTVLYESSEPIEVREGIEWAFLPQNASEKTQAAISALYEFSTGYLLRVSMLHDHEGFGTDEYTYFYVWEMGRWRLLAKAQAFFG